MKTDELPSGWLITIFDEDGMLLEKSLSFVPENPLGEPYEDYNPDSYRVEIEPVYVKRQNINKRKENQ